MALRTRFARLAPLALLLAGTLVSLSPGPAHAATIQVSTFSDDFGSDAGSCSLREGVQAAKTDAAFGGCAAGSGADLILLGAGTYTLSITGNTDNLNVSGDIDLEGIVTIRGRGARLTQVTASPLINDRVFHVSGSGNDVRIEGVAITGGKESMGFGGGGIYNQGILTLDEVAVRDNSTNVAAAGIRSDGTLTVTDSAVVSNAAPTSGGGIYMNTGTTSLTNVTLSGNRADIDGGGIYVNGPATANLTHVTIVDNTANADNSGSALGGGLSALGTVNMRSSIISGNRVGTGGSEPNCNANVTSQGYNVVEGGCTGLTGPGDLAAAGGLLGLANNGGPTDTHPISKSSPARNRTPSGCPAGDQRGAPRGGRCDSGAYELLFCAGRRVNRVGTPGNDLLVGTSRKDGMIGLGGKDKLRGRGGGDGLCGNGGKDRLIGGGGGDRLRGGGQNDRLFGGSGNDALNGGGGRDLCDGGSGRNTFARCET